MRRSAREAAIRKHQQRLAHGGVPPPDISSWPKLTAATTAGFRREWLAFFNKLPDAITFYENVLLPAERADRLAAEQHVLGREPDATNPDDWLAFNEMSWEACGHEDDRFWTRYEPECSVEAPTHGKYVKYRLIGTTNFCCTPCFRRIRDNRG